MRTIEKEIETVKGSVSENKKGVESNTRTIEELRRQMERDKKEMEERLETTKRVMREEWKEREVRRKNLVLHRVPEAPETISVGEERKKHDLEECLRIIRAAGMAGAESDIKACRRLGDKGDNPRPIILVLRTEEAKRQLLELARNLKGTDYQEISIVPDLTPEQRKEEAEMQEEAERRNAEELTDDDVSKNLKWSVVGQRGEKRLLKGRERTYPTPRGGRGTSSRGAGGQRRSIGLRGGMMGSHLATGGNRMLLGPQTRKRPAGFTPSARGSGRKVQRIETVETEEEEPEEVEEPEEEETTMEAENEEEEEVL